MELLPSYIQTLWRFPRKLLPWKQPQQTKLNTPLFFRGMQLVIIYSRIKFEKLHLNSTQTHSGVGECEGQPSSQQQGQNSQSQTVLSQINRQHSSRPLGLSWCPPIRTSSISITVAMATSICLKLKDTIWLEGAGTIRLLWGFTFVYLSFSTLFSVSQFMMKVVIKGAFSNFNQRLQCWHRSSLKLWLT